MSFNGKFPPGLFPRDLVAHWRFHPSQQLADSSGNGLTLGNANGTVNSTNRNDGWDLTANGTTSVFSVTSTKLDNLQPFTVEGWANVTGLGETGFGRLVTRENAVGSAGFWKIQCGSNSTLAFVKDYNGTDLSISSTNNCFVIGTRFHFAVTWDGTDLGAGAIIYTNGNNVSTNPVNGTTGAVSDASGTLYIGSNGAADRAYDGIIGPIRIWKKVLTQTQIGWIYQKFK